MRTFSLFFSITLLFSTALCSADVKELISKGDSLYEERENLENAKAAQKCYEDAIKEDPKNYEAHWKLAKTIYFIGQRSPENVRVSIFKNGVEIAKKAVALEPNKPEGHFWLGVLYGVYGEARGVMKSLFLVDDIKEQMNITLKLDPSIEGGGPYRLLGRMYYKLPGIAGGSKDKSLEYLLKAKEICPTNALTKIYIAETYLAKKMKEEAKKELREGIEMEPDLRWIPETKELKKQAKETL
ncbi:MAG: tetratricopeptide repeat protein, partial [Candidatus Aminicenantia bacterium]